MTGCGITGRAATKFQLKIGAGLQIQVASAEDSCGAAWGNHGIPGGGDVACDCAGTNQSTKPIRIGFRNNISGSGSGNIQYS